MVYFIWTLSLPKGQSHWLKILCHICKMTCESCDRLHIAKFWNGTCWYWYVAVFSFWIDCNHPDAPAGIISRSVTYKFYNMVEVWIYSIFSLVICQKFLAEIFRYVNRLTNGLDIHVDCLSIHWTIEIGIKLCILSWFH